MAELKEIFEMVTNRTEPDVDTWNDQEKRQPRSIRNRKLRAMGVVAAVVGGLALVVWVLPPGDVAVPAGTPTPISGPVTPSQELAFVDLGTGSSTPLPEVIGPGLAYVVSPDGTRVAYNPCCDPPIAVSVANIDGTNVQSIVGRDVFSSATAADLDTYGAAWSPDGATLVYQGRDGFTEKLGNLFLVDLGTGGTTQLTDLEQISSHYWFMSPHFSPDGSTIIFNQPRGPIEDQSWDLWSVPVTGGTETLVRRNAVDGSYSPDGTMITYEETRGVWLASADGSNGRLLVEGDEVANPRWSPDGTKIAYEDSGRVYVADVASGKAVEIAEGSWPEWFNDDTLIIGP